MTTTEIAQKVTEQFSDPNHYKQFREFQYGAQYRPYWELCMAALLDKELLGHIIFCNDIHRIPPVKTFLLYYRKAFQEITGREDAMLETFVKKVIGAFWGMVFKFGLGYQAQESVSISLNREFMVRTATCFMGLQKEIVLEG